MSASRTEFDLADLESKLKGKTLIVYWFLVQRPSHSVGVREIQRMLGFSSPSIAVHHLEKLQDLGLVRKGATGNYTLEQEVKVGVLQLFTRLGRYLVPRYLFYSMLFSTMLITYIVLCTLGQLSLSLYAVIFGAVAVIAFWIETVRIWKAKPF